MTRRFQGYGFPCSAGDFKQTLTTRAGVDPGAIAIPKCKRHLSVPRTFNKDDYACRKDAVASRAG
jgi:hypothetical protein